MIPREFIQRMRDTALLSEVIGRRVSLRRHGREFQACCPFHQEKTPSFTVNDQKGFYHCFGCSAHGDALNFIKEYEKLSYPDAVKTLASELGLSVPQPTPEAARREKQRASLQDVTELAAQWFQQQLTGVNATAARDYLRRRGLNQTLVTRFRLGYAPESRQGLREALLEKGVTDAQLIATGLAIKPDTGVPYDRFRGRVMFPILSNGGQVIAFGGRLLSSDEKAAKYLNSPETELFHKGAVLYNARAARAAVSATQPLLVVEGYMDVIALAKAGFSTGVAPLGTAMTETHLQMAWQMSDAPVVCLDGDAAGQRAMWRVAELALPLLQPGKTLRFCALPAGADPDDFLRQYGADAFRVLVDGAEPLSHLIVNRVRLDTGDTTPEQRAALEARLEGLAQKLPHRSLQRHFRRFFREQLWPRNRPAKSAGVKTRTFAAVPANQAGLVVLERQLLRAIFVQPALWLDHSVEQMLGGLTFIDESARELQSWLLDHPDGFATDDLPAAAVILAKDKSVSLPAIFDEQAPSLALVKEAVLQVMARHHMVEMEREFIGLQQELSNDFTDERLQRMLELKHELEQSRGKGFWSEGDATA